MSGESPSDPRSTKASPPGRDVAADGAGVQGGAAKRPATTPPANPLFAETLIEGAARPSSPESGDRSPFPQIPGYSIDAVLGRGGMGVVYRGRQLALNRPVALKMVLAGQYASPELLMRFLTEAESVASLQHPHIVQVYDLGTCDGNPFFAMEFVTGGNLGDKAAKQRMEFREAAEMTESLARAVQFAHDRGIIHRDLKPVNVLLTAEGTPKIADFGLAKRLNSNTDMTASGAILGTPGYLAPEQARGDTKGVNEGADIYALGVILYELLTGRVPFTGESDMEVLRQVIEADAPSPAWLRPNVPRDLETICLKCLEKNPKDRYATAAALAADLRNYMHGDPILARRRSRLERAWRWVQRRPARAIAVVALALAIAGSVRLWKDHVNERDYVKDSPEYFQTITRQWDVPQGLTPVSEGVVKRRALTYRITRRGLRGPVAKVESVNGTGNFSQVSGVVALVGANDASAARRESSLEYLREGQSGEVTRVVARDRSERTVWSFLFTSQTKARAQGHYVDEFGTPRARTGSGATGVKFDYSPEGYTLRQLYCDPLGNPQPNHDGSFGEKYEINEKGQSILVTNLGIDEQHTLHRNGYTKYRQAFDEAGNLREREFLDAEGQPTIVREGYSRILFSYDKYGNFVRSELFGLDGRPATHQDGYSRLERELDELGNMVSESYLDPEGKLAATSYGYSRSTGTYDEWGNRISAEFFGSDGKPTTGKAGYAKWTAKFDKHGNRLEVSYFGLEGKPVAQSDGYARAAYQYDAAGNLLQAEYFDTANKATLTKSGFSKQVSTWNSRNLQTSVAYFGLDQKPALHPDGYALLKKKHDAKGNVIEESYFDENGNPIEISSGIAKLEAKYERGVQVEVEYFDRRGARTLHRDGISRWQAKLDERGRESELRYFGIDSKKDSVPINNSEGFHRVAYTYDARGNRERSEYFDVSEKPTLHKDGYAAWIATYDKRGNMLERTNLGTDGKPSTLADGFATERFHYDARGYPKQVSYFDPDNRPAWHRRGYVTSKMSYDDRGNLIELAYYGPDDRLVMNSNHYAVIQTKYSDTSLILESRSLDVNRRPVLTANRVAGSNNVYDEKGRRISTTFVGLDNRATNSSGGYATVRSRYDDQGRLLEESYFDPQGKPTVSVFGEAKLKYAYDPLGRLIRLSKIGLDGLPAVHSQGHSELQREYDARGNLTTERFIGRDGKSILSKAGFAGWTGRYDSCGRRTEERHFGLDGRPINGVDGTAGYTTKYDSRGNSVETTYINALGKPQALANAGYATTKSTFDNGNRELEITLWGEDGEPVLNAREKFHRQASKYDARGNQIEQAYFGLKGQAVRIVYGFHRWTSEYDQLGLPLRRTYFDELGKVVPIAVAIAEVDPNGQAARVGLKAGDIFIAYDGAPVSTAQILIARRGVEFDFSKKHELTVKRGGETLKFTVMPGPLSAAMVDRAAEK